MKGTHLLGWGNSQRCVSWTRKVFLRKILVNEIREDEKTNVSSNKVKIKINNFWIF